MSSYNMLVIDDNEADQFLNQCHLESYNPDIKIVQAYDGQEALSIIAKNEYKFDYIFLDINMPRMNGFEFLKEYTDNQKTNDSTIIIMLTSSIQDDDEKNCLQYPQVKSFISKPLSKEKLDSCLKLT